jgi:segregation and condensation protein B
MNGASVVSEKRRFSFPGAPFPLRMSLKAKIEAVIYAAEEPVTLAQLAALFQSEVVEAREARLSAEAAAKLEAAGASEAETEAESHPSEQDAHEGVEHPEAEAQPVLETPLSEAPVPDGEGASDEASPNATPLEAVPSLEASSPEAGPEHEASPEPEGGSGEPAGAEEPVEAVPVESAPIESVLVEPVSAEPVPAEAGVPSVEDEKRAARQRDREIREELRRILSEMMAEYAESDRGMEIREIAGGYRVATKPEYHDAVRGFVKSLKPPMKLSLQALETLAVIAYKQPVTAPEVSEIRGVDSGGVLGSLVSRKLITTAGRKQVIGRPILYKTTKEFLLRFGLRDLNELPSIEEFEKMAGELADSEDVSEMAKPELPFQPEEVEAAAEAEEDSDEAREIRAQEDAEAEAAAVAAVGVSDESDAQGEDDLPGVVVEVEEQPADEADAEETSVGQRGEGD